MSPPRPFFFVYTSAMCSYGKHNLCYSGARLCYTFEHIKLAANTKMTLFLCEMYKWIHIYNISTYSMPDAFSIHRSTPSKSTSFIEHITEIYVSNVHTTQAYFISRTLLNMPYISASISNLYS
jgi:hypothetical protein